MSVARKAWLYGLSIIALGILVAGVRTLLATALDLAIRGSPQVESAFIQRQLSLGLAMLIIGAPLWVLFWRTIQRSVSQNVAEVSSTLRKFYLNLVILVSAAVALVNSSSFLVWLLSGAPRDYFPSGDTAFLVACGAVWYYHRSMHEAEGHLSPPSRTLRRWYIYILSGWGLIWLVAGIVGFVNSMILWLPIWGSYILTSSFWSRPVQTSLAWAMLGGTSWAFHWFKMSATDSQSALRQVYIYLVAITGSAIAGLVAVTYALNRFLLWAVGGAANQNGHYFQFLAWAIPLALVSAGVWSYHSQVAWEEANAAKEKRLSARRVHLYLMSFIGLGTMIAGLIILIGIVIDIPVNATSTGTVSTPGWWRSQVSAGIALLLVAVPIWVGHWSQISHIASSEGMAEWRARSRRVYLYVIIFVTIAALAADLVNILYQLLSGILTNTQPQFWRESRWSLQSLVVAVPVLVYHWRIARQDQRRGAEAAAIHKDVTVLLSAPSSDLVQRLEEKLGFKVRVLRCLTGGAAPNQPDLDGLVADIVAAIGPKVMVVACGEIVQVLSYEDS